MARRVGSDRSATGATRLPAARRRPASKLCMLTVFLAIVAGPFIGLVQPAYAAVLLDVTPTFPAAVAVGDTGVPASITITNVSTPPDDAAPVELEVLFPGVPAISLTPSCGSPLPVGPGDCLLPDLDVFALSPSGTGADGTACDGTTFTISIANPVSRKLSFEPDTPVVLQPPGSGLDTCTIDFTFDVLRVPTVDSQPAPGIQTSPIAYASGRNTTTNTLGDGTGVTSVTVLSPPGIATTATPTAPFGSPISDAAVVTGVGLLLGPTGTVTFSAYGPNDATCAGAPAFVSGPRPLTPSTIGPPPTATATSGPFTPAAPGTYRWVATYSGDAVYDTVSSACGDPSETSVVVQALATIATQATPTAVVGSAISDTATVTGSASGPSPTGTVTFTVFGPDDAVCSGPPAFTSPAQPLTPGAPGPPPTATADSGPFTPTLPGTYRWVATYSGDEVYEFTTNACGDPTETSVVNQAVATVATQATPTAQLGQPISDTATVTGAPAPAAPPTGTVTFTLFGPNNATCTGAPIFTSAAQPLGGGPPPTANSGPFTPTAPGTYRWVAAYSGDANYPAVTSACNDANETSVVDQAVATIATQATATVTVGSPISDTATVTGAPAPAPSPTGTVTFTLFGPDNATCTGAPIFTSAAQPLGGGPPPTANSGPFTPTAPGTYRWVAAYSGDANHPAVTSACGAANETSVVVQAPVTIDTLATFTAVIGSSISDTATVTGSTGAPSPTGTVTFSAFGPNDVSCAGPPAFTSGPQPLAPAAPGPPPTATAGSGPFGPTAAGTYRWTAVYSGDAVHPAATSPCNAPNESTLVAQATASLATTATPTVMLTQPISDTAAVSGSGVGAPSGTVTFSLFGPDDPTCSLPPAFTSAPQPLLSAVPGPPPTSTTTSGPFTPTAPGTYRWIASYSGDVAYPAVTGACNAANETSVVVQPVATITTEATPTYFLAQPISDTATVTGATGPRHPRGRSPSPSSAPTTSPAPAPPHSSAGPSR